MALARELAWTADGALKWASSLIEGTYVVRPRIDGVWTARIEVPEWVPGTLASSPLGHPYSCESDANAACQAHEDGCVARLLSDATLCAIALGERVAFEDTQLAARVLGERAREVPRT